MPAHHSTEEAPRARRPTIRDVAAAAGVSKSLVSLVYAGSSHVSPERKALVLGAAAELGFRPNGVARSLAGDRDDFVGILVADLHNPVFADVIDAARTELARHGRAGLLTSAILPGGAVPAQLDDHAVALFGDLRPSRLLIVGTIPDLDAVTAALPRSRIVIASASAGALDSAAVVRGDDTAGIELVVEHLIDRGHRDIAHVGGTGGAFASLRAAGYAASLRRRGLESYVRIEIADPVQAAGYTAAKTLLAAASPPTAIVAVNDLAAVGVLAAAAEYLRDTGRRVAVVGYDDTFLAALPQISLTTVNPGNTRIGTEAAQLLLGDDAFARATEILVAPTLVVRESTLSRP